MYAEWGGWLHLYDPMNWARGLFRLWIFISALWVSVVTYAGYEQWNERHPHWMDAPVVEGASKTKENIYARLDRESGIPVFDPSKPYEDDTPFDWWNYLLAAIGFPSVTLCIGMIGRWIGRGFAAVH